MHCCTSKKDAHLCHICISDPGKYSRYCATVLGLCCSILIANLCSTTQLRSTDTALTCRIRIGGSIGGTLARYATDTVSAKYKKIGIKNK
jgi:hypothetical protein